MSFSFIIKLFFIQFLKDFSVFSVNLLADFETEFLTHPVHSSVVLPELLLEWTVSNLTDIKMLWWILSIRDVNRIL